MDYWEERYIRLIKFVFDNLPRDPEPFDWY